MDNKAPLQFFMPTRKIPVPSSIKKRDPLNHYYLAVVGAQSFGNGLCNTFPLLCTTDSFRKVDPNEFPNYGHVFLTTPRDVAEIKPWEFVLINPQNNWHWPDDDNRISKFIVRSSNITSIPALDSKKFAVILNVDDFDPKRKTVTAPQHDVTPFFFVKGRKDVFYGPLSRKQCMLSGNLIRHIEWDFVSKENQWEYENDGELRDRFSAQFLTVSPPETLWDPVIKNYRFILGDDFSKTSSPLFHASMIAKTPESPKPETTPVPKTSATKIISLSPVPTIPSVQKNDEPSQTPPTDVAGVETIQETAVRHDDPVQENPSPEQETGDAENKSVEHDPAPDAMPHDEEMNHDVDERERNENDNAPLPWYARSIDSKKPRPEFLNKNEMNSEPLVFGSLYHRLLGLGGNYSKEFFANIYVCLKSFPLNLLSGPPGCGKSTLVRLLSKAMGHEDTRLDISVRRKWADDRDLLGGYDGFNNHFDPGHTGLSPRLAWAEEDWSQVDPKNQSNNRNSNQDNAGFFQAFHLILMDEFNLAPPEYYFSALLQKLDREQGERKIELYQKRPDGRSSKNGNRSRALENSGSSATHLLHVVSQHTQKKQNGSRTRKMTESLGCLRVLDKYENAFLHTP